MPVAFTSMFHRSPHQKVKVNIIHSTSLYDILCQHREHTRWLQQAAAATPPRAYFDERQIRVKASADSAPPPALSRCRQGHHMTEYTGRRYTFASAHAAASKLSPGYRRRDIR